MQEQNFITPLQKVALLREFLCLGVKHASWATKAGSLAIMLASFNFFVAKIVRLKDFNPDNAASITQTFKTLPFIVAPTLWGIYNGAMSTPRGAEILRDLSR